MDWEREGLLPPEVFQKFAAANMLIPTLPAPLPVEWLKKLDVHDILGVVKVEEWDYIHTAIYTDEVRIMFPQSIVLTSIDGQIRHHWSWGIFNYWNVIRRPTHSKVR